MDDFYLRIKVQGAQNEEEAKWAEKTGIRCHGEIVNKFLNPIWIKWYNLRWDLYEKLTRKTVDRSEDGEYTKQYIRKSSKIATNYCRRHGGIRGNRAIRINMGFLMRPTENKKIYVTDDFIYVEDIGE